jgi:TatD DNase family protein
VFANAVLLHLTVNQLDDVLTKAARAVGARGLLAFTVKEGEGELRSALEVLAMKPKIVSLHSYAATDALIDELEANPIKGAVLHWWLGDVTLTERAVHLGCYFSVNASSARKSELMTLIPSDRLLTETDRPFGDRREGAVRAPGIVDGVEKSLARLHGTSTSEARLLLWQNLSRLVRDVGCSSLLPREVRAWLAVAT